MVHLFICLLWVKGNFFDWRYNQGDALAMAMYALAVMPLIKHLRTTVPDVSQVWFADDSTTAGTHIFCPGGSFSWSPLLDQTMVTSQMLLRLSFVKPEHLSAAQDIMLIPIYRPLHMASNILVRLWGQEVLQKSTYVAASHGYLLLKQVNFLQPVSMSCKEIRSSALESTL